MVIFYNPSITEHIKRNEEVRFHENFNWNGTLDILMIKECERGEEMHGCKGSALLLSWKTWATCGLQSMLNIKYH